MIHFNSPTTSSLHVSVLRYPYTKKWEEEVTDIYVDSGSCFADTHEEGWHKLPRNLTQEELDYHAQAIINWFNKTRRGNELERFFIQARIEE